MSYHHQPDICKGRIVGAVTALTPDDEFDIIGLHLLSWFMCNLSDHVRWHLVTSVVDIELLDQYLSLAGFVLVADTLFCCVPGTDEPQ